MNPASPSSPQSSPNPNQQQSTTLSHRPSPRQTPSSGTPPGSTANAPIPDDEHGADLPMNMSASVMLTNLPRDAHQALADVERIDSGKGIHHLPYPQWPSGFWTGN
jgi:ubiquitin-like protein ATG12